MMQEEVIREGQPEEIPTEGVAQPWSRDSSGRLYKTNPADSQARGPSPGQTSGHTMHPGFQDRGKGVDSSHPQPTTDPPAAQYMSYPTPPQYPNGAANPAPSFAPHGSHPTPPIPITREEMQNCIRDMIAASTAAPKAKSIIEHCKLPPVTLPHKFKVPKYRLYDGTTDPHQHVSGFIMDSHHFLYDQALLVHLFQRSLEGDALKWFTSLSASELSSFDVVAERFAAHFSYLVGQSPTLCDLVSEKMKPDEDFIAFANRWRTMAAQSEVAILEKQAVSMLVTNTTPPLWNILLYSDLRSFQQLYNRARAIQN